MSRNLIIILALLLLNNCATSGSALLGPIFTGAKTGSIYQASLSYGSNKIFHDFKKSNNRKNNEISKSIPVLESAIIEMPKILSTFTIAKVEYSDLIEPEPLP